MSPPVAAVAPVTPGLYQVWREIWEKNPSDIVLHPVLFFSSRCPAGCFVPATAGDREPAGHHHGKASVWNCLLICFTALVSDLMRHFLRSQAQQMTMQAMAIVSSPVTSPPTSPITSPPMSPLLHHPPSPYTPSSPYAVIPPSPYANFTPTPYAGANIPPSPYAPTTRREQTPSQAPAEPQPRAQPQAPRPDLKSQPSSARTNKTEPAQPKANPAAQVSNCETCEVTVQTDIVCNDSARPRPRGMLWLLFSTVRGAQNEKLSPFG